MRYLLNFTFTLLLSLFPYVSSLANEHDHHGAHVHGEAELTLAIEGNTLQINFLSPADSILGFEHKAETSDEVNKIAEVSSLFNNVETIFSLSNGTCQLDNNENNLGSLLPETSHEDHHDEHAHKHESEHEHKHEHEEEHAHKKEHEHAEHTELSFSYTLICKTLSAENSATVNLFENFKGINKIRALWITESGQGAATLTPNNNTLAWK